MDKWLVYARFVKHRSDADALIEGGHVRLNRVRVSKTGHPVKEGDILTLTLHSGVRIIKVTGEAERRGPATEARKLYEDVAENRTPDQDAQNHSASSPEACYHPPRI